MNISIDIIIDIIVIHSTNNHREISKINIFKSSKSKTNIIKCLSSFFLSSIVYLINIT